MSRRIAYTKPSIGDREVEYATDAARNGWGVHCYDYIHRFEKAFADHLGVANALATSSCTGAMHMGVHGLGIGQGDEIILADINWIATVAPIVHVGATPILVDIRPDSWCIDPAAAEAAITPATKAIVATHLYGNLCDLDALKVICDRHGLTLIEDAAEALGSEYRGQPAGSIGRFGTFSFHATKTVTTGEGGMFVTDDPELFETVLTLSNHGRARGQAKQFWADMVGFKYKMSNVQAAIGCAQLERIGELVERKRAIFATYKAEFGNFPGAVNPEPEGCRNGYWMPTMVFDSSLGPVKNTVLSALQAGGVDARVFFHPLSDMGHFERRHATPVSHDISARAINLPSYHDMADDDVRYVVDIVRKAVGVRAV